MVFKKAVEIVPIWNNKDLTEGSVLEGNYEKQEIMTGNFGEQQKYIIIKSDGEKVCLAGSASIVAQMNNVPEGSLVRVTYKGKETTKKGNTVKVFEIEYDDDNL